MQNAGGIIIVAPAFHGKAEDRGAGTTPEDFISQVENLRGTHGWDGLATSQPKTTNVLNYAPRVQVFEYSNIG